MVWLQQDSVLTGIRELTLATADAKGCADLVEAGAEAHNAKMAQMMAELAGNTAYRRVSLHP